MNPIRLMRKTYDFNKRFFTNSYSIVEAIHDQTEQIITSWLEWYKYLPKREKDIIYEYMKTYKKHRAELKGNIDDGYLIIRECFAGQLWKNRKWFL